MRFFFFPGLLLFCLAMGSSPALSQEVRPYAFQADNMAYDPATGAYTAKGNVRIEDETMMLTADQVTYIPETGEAIGEGAIVLRMGEDRMEGDRIVYNLGEQKGFLENGYLFVSQSEFRIKGKKIERTGEQSYLVEGARLTTCDGENPDWAITASRIALTLEGYGTLNHAAFRIKGVPTLYTPWLFFPAKIKRQSGLLIPEISISDRYGYEHLQPLYLALGEDSDATLYFQFMEKSQPRFGLEYRKLWSDENRLTLRLDGLVNSDPTEEARLDGASPDRYWFRMKQDFSFSGDVQGFVDLDIVSDTEYFDDFDGGSLGFNNTDTIFQQEFGRGLDPEDEDTRTNRILLSKTTDVLRMEGEFVWEDDVRDRTLDLEDDTVQRLPRLSVASRRQQISDLPLYHNFEGESAYFYRIDGEKGARANLAPRISAPFRAGPVSIEPSFGLDGTFWYTENPLEEKNNGYETESRFLYDAELDLFTEIDKVFGGGIIGADKIRHSLQPRMTFEYVPEKDQEDLPFFDDLDRIEKKRRLTYSLTQTLTARFQETTDEEEGPQKVYKDFMRFKIFQDYDMDRAEIEGEDGFSDATGEISLFPMTGVRIFGDASWSTVEDDWSAYSSGTEITKNEHFFYAEYRYDHDTSESLHLRGYLAIRENLGLLWDYEHNLKESISHVQDYGVRYKSGCWQTEVVYSEDEDSRKIGFFWTLTGLGEMEHSLGDSFFERVQ